MDGEVLLDTSILVAFLQGEQEVVDRLLNTQEAFIPAVVLGELYFGADKSHRATENRRCVDRLTEWAVLAVVDETTARHYGALKAQLHRKGRPIPDNDLWIASTAVQHGLTLVTRDKHFAEIENLELTSW